MAIKDIDKLPKKKKPLQLNKIARDKAVQTTKSCFFNREILYSLKLVEKIGVTERYLYQVENEGKKSRYDILYKLICELSIQPDLIFYPPEKTCEESEAENLIRMLYQCDERSLKVVKATVKALIDTADTKQPVHC